MDNILQRGATENTFVECLHYILVALDSRCRETAQSAAILLGDDNVLRHVHQTTREVTGVGRLEGGIGQTFTRTVGRYEVLEHRQTLLEVREDRVLDDLRTLCTRLLGLGHKTTHTRKLTYLLFRTAGTRVEHHVNGVETLVVFGQLFKHRLRELGVGVRPYINDLVVTFVVGDKTHAVAVEHLFHLSVTVGNQSLFLLGNDDGVEIERQTALERHLITEVLDVVEELGRTCGTRTFHHHTDDVAERFLGKQFVYVADLLGHELVEKDSAYCGLYQLGTFRTRQLHTHFHLCVQVGHTLVVGNDSLLGRVEHQPFTLDTLTGLGYIIETEHHVLRGDGDGGSVGGVENVVRTEHQKLGLEYGGVAERQVHCHLVTVEVGVERRT